MHGDQIHVGIVVGIQGPHVSPVAAVAIGGTGHHIEGKVIDAGLTLIHQIGDDVGSHIVHGTLIRGIRSENVNQCLRREDVVAHGHVRLVLSTDDAGGVRGLLEEAPDARRVTSGVDDAKLMGEGPRLTDAGHGHRRSGVDVRLHHLHGIHAVDVVGTEDRDVIRLFVVDEVEALEDRVRTAGEPPWPQALLSRHGRDVVAQER